MVLGEPLYAFGYLLGSLIKGEPVVFKGAFSGTRWLPIFNMDIIEANITLVEGISGGSLVDSCGKVVGMNGLGIDTSMPEGVVKAFYVYIKPRNLKEAFNLISIRRRASINSFEEWGVRAMPYSP